MRVSIAASRNYIAMEYKLFPMPTLNRVMDLQGGITTCIGETVVQRAATEDLKLPYLYDSSTKTVADGEGVWLAVGSASSNPSVGFYYSVIYKGENYACRIPVRLYAFHPKLFL